MSKRRINMCIDYAGIKKAIKEMEADGFLFAIREDKMIVIGKPIKNTKEKVVFT